MQRASLVSRPLPQTAVRGPGTHCVHCTCANYYSVFLFIKASCTYVPCLWGMYMYAEDYTKNQRLVTWSTIRDTRGTLLLQCYTPTQEESVANTCPTQSLATETHCIHMSCTACTCSDSSTIPVFPIQESVCATAMANCVSFMIPLSIRWIYMNSPHT